MNEDAKNVCVHVLLGFFYDMQGKQSITKLNQPKLRLMLFGM